MKVAQIVLVILLSAVTAFAVGRFAPPASTTALVKETAYERVMRTGTIRCGYIISPPFLALDPKTGQKSGVAFDYVTAIGQELGLKITWAEEVTWGTFAEGLTTGRYDVMCMPLWESGGRAKAAIFTKPLYDSNISLIARADDTRFNSSLESANNKNTVIATVEGEISRTIRERRLPLTKELALPPGLDDGQYFMNIITHKADIGFAFQYVMEKFNEGSEKKLKIVGQDQVLQSYNTALTVAHGESDLKFMLDSAISTLIKSGQASTILSSYKGVSLPSSK